MMNENETTVMGDLYATRSDLFIDRSRPVSTIGNTPEVPNHRQSGLAAALAHRGSR